MCGWKEEYFIYWNMSFYVMTILTQYMYIVHIELFLIDNEMC